jgi:hypothetical protein
MSYWLMATLLTITLQYGSGAAAAASAGKASPAARAAARPDAAGRYVSFPSVGVRLIKPAGFTDAERFHGFEQQDTVSSVLLLRIPGPYSECTKGFNSAELKPRGMVLLHRQERKVDGKPGVFLKVRQSAYGTTFLKWIVAFGDESQTFMVTGTFPESHAARLSPLMKSTVLSARLEGMPLADPDTDALFTITPAGKMKRSLSFGKSVGFSKDGVRISRSPADPVFIASPSLSEASGSDRSSIATHRLLGTEAGKVSSITSHEPIRIDNLDGYESVAEAEHTPSATPLVVYQVILFDAKGFFLMQGIVGAEQRAEYLPIFQAMARSFKQARRP